MKTSHLIFRYPLPFALSKLVAVKDTLYCQSMSWSYVTDVAGLFSRPPHTSPILLIFFQIDHFKFHRSSFELCLLSCNLRIIFTYAVHQYVSQLFVAHYKVSRWVLACVQLHLFCQFYFRRTYDSIMNLTSFALNDAFKLLRL